MTQQETEQVLWDTWRALDALYRSGSAQVISENQSWAHRISVLAQRLERQ